MSTKTRQRRHTPKPTPAPRAHLMLVDLRRPLPVRRRRFTGPATPSELTEARATLASAAAQLPIPHLAWHAPGGGRAHAVLADGTVITHVAHRAPVFTAHLPSCPTGAVHETTITTASELAAARNAAATCTRQHTTSSAHSALTQRPTQPRPPAVRTLGEGLHRATASAADTQSLSLADIADTLDQPKEHPEP